LHAAELRLLEVHADVELVRGIFSADLDLPRLSFILLHGDGNLLDGAFPAE
jgi:hypothetical protein